MVRYFLKRLLLTPVTMLMVVTVIFFLSHSAPGSAIRVALGPHATPEQVEKLVKKYSLDKPIYIQYGIFLGNLLQGNLGESIVRGRTVTSELGTYLPASIELVGLAIVIIAVVGIFLGVVSAVRKNRIYDTISRGIAVGGVATPDFWLALMLVLAFSYGFRLLPSTGRINPLLSPPSHVTGLYLLDSLITGNGACFWDSLLHLAMPVFTLAITHISTTVRLTRDGMLKVLREDYITMARVYSLRPSVIYFKYALKNAILPVMTNLGMTTAALFSGAFVVETVFSFPGIGYYATTSILNFDYAPMIGAIIVISGLYVILNLMVDIAYSFIDPRIRY
jgi:peptide/nickel transport system permease protein